MERFIEQYGEQVSGTLSGFDRVLFRGNCGSIYHAGGMARFLSSQGVLQRDCATFSQRLTARLMRHAREYAKSKNRPYDYVASSDELKESIAQGIAERDGITDDLVCILRCVEPCRTYGSRRNERGEWELAMQTRKCLFLYFYFMDREFGLMHVRLQTWVPFTIQVCLNGREYLARALSKADIAYTKADNCFREISDLPRAQDLLDRLTTREWARTLDVFARRANPWLTATKGLQLHGYNWTLRQSEWATDVMFRDAAALSAVYKSLARHAIDHFQSEDVLRFFGQRRSAADITSQFNNPTGGTRVRHQVYENSIKMYDKQGSVLRIETTINNPGRFKVTREPGRDGKSRRLAMRKGLADLHQRVRLSQEANERYLDALAVVHQRTSIDTVVDPLQARITNGHSSFRSIRPVAPDDCLLLAAVSSGTFVLDGFTHRELAARLPGRNARQISRSIALLRAHSIVERQPGSHRYRITQTGRIATSTCLLLRNTSIERLAA